MINFTTQLVIFSMFAKRETRILRDWGIAREVAITTLTVYLLGNNLGLTLRIFFATALIKNGTIKETILQPLNLLGEYSYY